jgi:hypothetical protein
MLRAWMTPKSSSLLLVMMLACGKSESIATTDFANEATVTRATIVLQGNASGAPVTDSTCTYRVDGNEIAFDIHVTRASGGCAGSANPSMLKTTCTGPHLAAGHYRVKGDPTLRGDVTAASTGDLTRVFAE